MYMEASNGRNFFLVCIIINIKITNERRKEGFYHSTFLLSYYSGNFLYKISVCLRLLLKDVLCGHVTHNRILHSIKLKILTTYLFRESLNMTMISFTQKPYRNQRLWRMDYSLANVLTVHMSERRKFCKNAPHEQKTFTWT